MILAKTGDVKYVQAYLQGEALRAKEAAQTRQAATAADNSATENVSKVFQRYQREAGNARTPQELAQNVYRQYQDPVTRPEVLKQEPDMMKAMSRYLNLTPKEFPEVQQKYVMGMSEFIKDQTTRSGQTLGAQTAAAGQAVTARGQDIGAATAAAGQAVTARGQDIGATTAANAQEIAKQRLELDRQKAEDALNKAKALTQDQGKATSWLERMNQAEQIITAAPEHALTSTGSISGVGAAAIKSIPILGSSNIGEAAQNAVVSKERQAVLTAEAAWVSGLLRSDTGAAYKDMEKDDIVRTFFPQPFDNSSTKTLKKNLRDGVRKAMEIRAGPGADTLSPSTGSAIRRYNPATNKIE
jgi:hypothetical protein